MTDQTATDDKQFVIDRLAHYIDHCYKAIERLTGSICALADEVRKVHGALTAGNKSIEQLTREAVIILASDVVDITVEDKEDHTGDQAKFFMVLFRTMPRSHIG